MKRTNECKTRESIACLFSRGNKCHCDFLLLAPLSPWTPPPSQQLVSTTASILLLLCKSSTRASRHRHCRPSSSPSPSPRTVGSRRSHPHRPSSLFLLLGSTMWTTNRSLTASTTEGSGPFLLAGLEGRLKARNGPWRTPISLQETAYSFLNLCQFPLQSLKPGKLSFTSSPN